MALTLHTIKPNKGARKRRMRVGRGLAKKGTTSGRGQKGQKARSGVSGLQLKGIRSLMLAQPKLRGFQSHRRKVEEVNVGVLNEFFNDGEEVTIEKMVERGLIKGKTGLVKILGKGEIEKKIIVKGCRMSEGAKEKIEKAGGKME